MRNLALAFLLSAATLVSAQSAKHPFTVDDAATLRHAYSAAVSPDGKTVLYRVSFGAQKGPDTSEWQLIATTGGEPSHLALPEHFTPAGFTADGKALYGSLRVDKSMQLAILPLAPPNTPVAAAASPTPLTALPRGVQGIYLSPDGRLCHPRRSASS